MLVKLDLAFDYPVGWSFETVLRDFAQNFYDSIGYQNFDKDFELISNPSPECPSWADDVVMQTKGHSFDYEWLMYIGASTKTEKPSEYVGQYGEGFKMGVLSCMQNEWCIPVMESDDWVIRPCIYTETIDGKEVKMLGYDMQKRQNDGYTRLTLEKVSKYSWEIKEVKLNFYYPENPLIGKKIAESDNCIIHERSKTSIPGILSSNGILFCNYLARGVLDFKLVIMFRKDLLKEENRSRTTYSHIRTIAMLMECAEQMDSRLSYALLMKLRDKWDVMPNGAISPYSLYYLICQLVRNIAGDEELSTLFKQEHNNLAYIERKTIDRMRNMTIDEASKWIVNMANKDFVTVNPIFRLLGAKSLVEEYVNHKIDNYASPSKWQMDKISILYETIDKIYAVKLYDDRPNVLIDKSQDTVPHILNMKKRYLCNKRDRRKYTFDTIIINEKDFSEKNFNHVLIKWFNLLTYSFGTPKSAFVNALFTDFLGDCIKYRKFINEMEEKWNVGT